MLSYRWQEEERGRMASVIDTAVFDRLGLPDLPDSERGLVAKSLRRVDLPAGATVFSPGALCAGWIMVEEGSVRVSMTSDTGREILLYRVGAGESCVLTTACLFGEEPYAATGVTEMETRAILVPAATVFRLIDMSASFRKIVFRGFGHRITDILRTMEDAVFHRLDARIATLLLERAGTDGIVTATQAELAAELGSAREVVSRKLGKLSDAGILERQRGTIRVMKPDALQRIRLDGE